MARVDYKHGDFFQGGFSLFYGGAGQGFSNGPLTPDTPTRTFLGEGHVPDSSPRRLGNPFGPR